MPGGDRVGEAYVDIHVNAGPGEAELAAFKSKVDRDFEELARKKAEASLQLKSTEFDAKIEKAKTELDNLEHRRARASVSLDKGRFDAEIAEAKAEIKALGREKAKVRLDMSQLRDANRETRLLAKGRELDERAALGQAKAERKIVQERERATREVQRGGQVEARARAQNAKYDAERIDAAVKNRAELARLSDEYEKLRGRQIGMEKSSRRVFSPRSLGQAESEARRLERVASEADYVKHKIEKLGGSVAHLDPQISHNSSLLDRWLSRLGDTSIRLGPITTSIKGLAAGLGLLGPILFEVGGGVTALAGTIGEGLAGGAVVAAGAFAGLATSAAGVGFVVAPMIGEFKEVSKASEALHKAVLKYGKGSEQAATYQERLNNELHGVSPIAKEAFQDYGSLKTQWKSLTKAARPAVFTAFGEGLKTVQSLLPGFASESVKTTQVAGKAWDGWMKSLRSSEAKHLLGSIMSDFRASIPGLASGLASLGAMFGRLAAAGAHFLPGLSNGFADWANNLENAVGGGTKLTSKVGDMVNQMQDLGHLSQDTGSLLVHIFDAGAHSGEGMVKSLDHVIQRWDKWTQSASGKSGLNQFFGESKTATEDLMSSLGHMTKLLFAFSRATAPVANGLLKVVTFIGDIVTAADDLVGVKQVFQGIGILLAGMWVASKVLAYADSIALVSARLGAFVGVETAAAAATEAEGAAAAETAVALEAEAAASAEAAAAAAALGVATAEADLAMGAGLAEGAAGAGVAMEGAAGSAGILATALAPEVLIPAAAIAGLALLVSGMGKAETAFEQATAKFRRTSKEIPSALHEAGTATDRYVEAQQRNKSATEAVIEARHHLAKLQRENAPVAKQTAAVEALNQAEHAQAHQAHETGVINKQQITAQKELVSGAKARVRSAESMVRLAKEEAHSAKRDRAFKNQVLPGAGDARVLDATKHLTAAERALAVAKGDVADAQQREIVTAIPWERSIKGLAPISKTTEQGLRQLSQTIGGLATKKIGNFVNPQDVQRVTDLGNRLTKLGRGGQVKNIAVKSQGADQTISKLQRLQKQTNRVEGTRATIKVGANDAQAQSKLKRLGALSQRLAGTKQTVHILANSSSAEQAIQRLRQHLTDVVTHQYKAELKAEDKSGATANNFHHHMQGVASQKYEARITAIDQASSKAKTAEGAAKRAGQQHPKINITATNSQALGAISAVQSSLASLHSKSVTVTVNTVHTGGGKAEGGESLYMPRPVVEAGGRSRRVTRPTMLTGEEAPRHPEYVIATNPAYRESNKRYLEDAAGDLGYEVIPAYKKGKGKKSGGSAGTAAEKQAKTLAHHPPNPKHRAHKIAKVEKWGPVAAYNAAETDAQIKEEIYGQVFSHDEAEIKAGRMDNWEFARLRGLLADEVQDYHKLSNLVPDIKNTVNQELGHIHGLIDGGGEFSKKTIRGLNRQMSKEKAKLSKLKKGKNESDASFRKRKLPYENAITGFEVEIHKKEKERERLVEIRAEAKQELSEVSGAKKMNEAKTNAERSEDELQYVEDVETGAVEAPYAEAQEDENIVEESEEFKRAKADLVDAGLRGDVPGEEAARAHMIAITEREYAEAKNTASPEDDIDIGERLKQLKEETQDNGGKGTIGEQTASLSEARENLYKEFASNITGPGIEVRSMPSGGGASIYATMAAPETEPNYTPAAVTQIVKKTTDAIASSGGGTVNNVNNYFSAPPPDPLTWTKQQEWELSNL